MVSGDSLYACGPAIKLVEKCEMSYIFSSKESRVPLVIGHHRWSKEKGLTLEKIYHSEIGIKVKKKITHKFSYKNKVALNNTHDDLHTNILEYEEITEWVSRGEKKKKKMKFCWITNIHLHEGNIWKIMRGGRSRWKIESVPQKHIGKEVMKFSA